MDSQENFAEFLAKVDTLRSDDSGVQITAHTSNVAVTGWVDPPAAESDLDR